MRFLHSCLTRYLSYINIDITHVNKLVSLGFENKNVNTGNNHRVFSLSQKLQPRLIKDKEF